MTPRNIWPGLARTEEDHPESAPVSFIQWWPAGDGLLHCCTLEHNHAGGCACTCGSTHSETP